MSNTALKTGNRPHFGSWGDAASYWTGLVTGSTPPLVVNGVEVQKGSSIYQAALQVRSMGPVRASEASRRAFELAAMSSTDLMAAKKEWGHLCLVDSLSTADIRLPASVAARPHKEDMINIAEPVAGQSAKIRRLLSATGCLQGGHDESAALGEIIDDLIAGDCRHTTNEFRCAVVEACRQGSSEVDAVYDALFQSGVMGAYQSSDAAGDKVVLFATPELMGQWIDRDRIVAAEALGPISAGDSILVTEAKSGTQKSVENKVRELIKASVLEGEIYRDAVSHAQIAARRGRLPDCAVSSAKINHLRAELADQVELVSMERSGSWSASLATSKDLVVTRHAAATASNCTDAAYLAASIDAVGRSADKVIGRLKGEGISSPEAAFLVLDEMAYKLAHISSIDAPKSAQTTRDLTFLTAFAGEAVKPMITDVRNAVYSDRAFGSIAESVIVTVTERQDKLEVREVGYSSGSGSAIEASTIWLPTRRFGPSDVAVEDLPAISSWRLSIEGVCEDVVSKKTAGQLSTAVTQFAAHATERCVRAEDDIAAAALLDGEYRLGLAAAAALTYAAAAGFNSVQFSPPSNQGKSPQNAANLYPPAEFSFNRDTGALLGWCKSSRLVFSSRAVAIEELDRIVGAGATKAAKKQASEDPNRPATLLPVTMSLSASAHIAATVANAVNGNLYVASAVKASEALGLQVTLDQASPTPSKPAVSVQLGEAIATLRRAIGAENHARQAVIGPGM